MNSIQVIGNLGGDPSVKYFESGAIIAEFTIYYNERFKKNGQAVERPHRFNIKAWAKTAEFAAEYLRKGSRVAISGKLIEETWQDRETGANRSRLLIQAASIDNLTAKNGAEHSANNDEFEEF